MRTVADLRKLLKFGINYANETFHNTWRGNFTYVTLIDNIIKILTMYIPLCKI